MIALALLAPRAACAADAPTPASTPSAQQVQMDAKFLEVQQGQIQQLGFQWSVTNPAHPDNSVSTGGDNATTANPSVATMGSNLRVLGDAFPSGSAAAQAATSSNGTVVTNPVTGAATIVNDPQTVPTLPGGINVGASLLVPISADTFNSLNGLKNGYPVQAIINALTQTEGASLMAAPKITVLSGKEAAVTITNEDGTTVDGVKVPRDSFTPPISITFNVQPVVNADNSVDYSIKATITEQVSQQAVSGGVVQHANVTELVTSGHAVDGQTVAFDLGIIDRAIVAHDSAPGSDKVDYTPMTLHHHRYAIFAFNIIQADGTVVRGPTSNSSPAASSPPPANP
jgi:type II secretory pathway component GspD/PulD (secretin)